MKVIISYIFLFLTFHAITQNVQVISSEEFEKRDSSYDFHFFWNDGGMITIKAKDWKDSNRDMVIQILKGEKLKEEKFIEFTLPYSDAIFEYVYEIDNTLYLFYSSTQNNKNNLFAQKIDKNTGEFIDNEKLVLSIKEGVYAVPRKVFVGNGMMSMGVNSKQGKFQLSISPNGKHILFKYFYQSKKGNSNLSVVAFNDQLEEMWRNDQPLKFSAQYTKLLSFEVNNKGEGFLLAKGTKNTANKYLKDPKNFFLSVFKFTKSEITEINLKIEENLLQSALLKINNDQVICAGYYYTPNRKLIKGFFTTLLNKNKFEEPQFYNFTPDLVRQFVKTSNGKHKSNEKKYAKGTLGISNLNLMSLNILSDGGFLLLGEQHFNANSQALGNHNTPMTGGGSMHTPGGIVPGNTVFSTPDDPNFAGTIRKDMVVVKLSSQGEPEWMNKIPKRSYGNAMINDQNLYILFRDSPSNFELPNNKEPKDFYGAGNLVVYKVSLNDGSRKNIKISGAATIDGIPISAGDRSMICQIVFPLLSKNGYAVQLRNATKNNNIFQFILE